MSDRDSELIHYFDLDPPAGVSRRQFVRMLGGGVVIAISAEDLIALQRRRMGDTPDDFNAFLRIGADGRVTCLTGKIEMGQGVITSLAQMLADELEVPLSSVDMTMGDTDLTPWDMGTFGSMTTRFFGPLLRAAAAEAREVLLQMAAERFDVLPGQLTVRDGVISVASNPERSVSYAELTGGKAVARRLGRQAVLEAAADFEVVGTPVRRRDAAAKVTGAARYAGDIRLPDMLYARLVRPPAHGAKLVEIDTTEAARLQGVMVVADGDLVAVLAPSPDQAERALERVKTGFEGGPSSPDEESIYDHLLGVKPPGVTGQQAGDLATGREAAAATVERTYLDSYCAHAPIETHTATAAVDKGRVTIWASTQTPFGLQEEAASALGVEKSAVRVIPPFVGGGFGGKTANQQAVEAARLASLSGRPVQVAWTRAEEFFYDHFRPAAVVKISAGVDGGGRICLWDYVTYFAGSRGSEIFYDVPNLRTVAAPPGWRGVEGAHPFATGAWRAPGNNTNTFARESHIDILAAEAEMDPVEFRMRNLTDPRMKRTLKAVADAFGWSTGGDRRGRGWGVACGIDAGTYVALIAEVEVDRSSGEVRVTRMVCAQDMGLVINPAGATIQMEGCLTMGLGYTLSEELRFSGGRIHDTNFDTYRIPRFSWLPEIETVLVDAGDAPPQGGGEPAIIVVGGAVANAVCDASGARVLRLPMTPQRVMAAMNQA